MSDLATPVVLDAYSALLDCLAKKAKAKGTFTDQERGDIAIKSDFSLCNLDLAISCTENIRLVATFAGAAPENNTLLKFFVSELKLLGIEFIEIVFEW